MKGIYYFGDYVMSKSQSMIDVRYLFSGAQSLDDGRYAVTFSVFTNAGYAGGGCPVTLTVRPGDEYRLGAGFSAWTDRDQEYGKKSKSKVETLHFDAITPDCIEISYR